MALPEEIDRAVALLNAAVRQWAELSVETAAMQEASEEADKNFDAAKDRQNEALGQVESCQRKLNRTLQGLPNEEDDSRET